MNPAIRFALVAITLVVCLAASPSFAADPPNPPTTRPANPLVLVLPISPPEGTYGWVGKAIQQDIMVDLTQMTHARVIAPSTAPAADADAALKAARDANADYVAFGQAQVLGGQLRVTGQILDVHSGQLVSPLKVTAPVDNLFPLEDALAAQAARAISPSMAGSLPTTPEAYARGQSQPAPAAPYYAPELNPSPRYESVPADVPGYYAQSPAYYASPYPYYYGPDYYYPGYLAFGFWGPGVIIERNHFHGHFDHDFDHRPFFSQHVNPGIFNRGSFGRSSFGRPNSFGARPGFGGSHMGGFGGSGGGMHAGGDARGR